MAEKEEDRLEMEPTRPLDISKFTMNEVVTDHSRDRAGIAKQISLVTVWVLVGLLIAWGLVTLNNLTASKQGTGVSLGQGAGARAPSVEFQENVINRSPVLMTLVKTVQFQGDTTLVAELLPSVTNPDNGKERLTAKADWEQAGTLLLVELRTYAPKKTVQVALVLGGRVIGIYSYDAGTKQTTSQWGENLPLPGQEDEHGHEHGGHEHGAE